ncbi:MAG: hypothetical protein N2560_00465 [Ignavibacteria bacterium]|nr:hypothetical protein [Ignavibacteria bacterium]
MKKFIPILFVFAFIACNEYQTFKLNEFEVVKVEIAKPYGIYYSNLDSAYFISSEEGIIAKLDANMKILNYKKFENTVFSQIFADEYYLYAITKKEIIKLDKQSFEIQSKIALSKLGLGFTEIKGFYFNPLSKTFDFIHNKKNKIYLVQFNPIDFRRVKTKKILKDNAINCAFKHNKFLFILSKKNEINILDINNFSLLDKKFSFIGPNISSGTIIYPNILVLLSRETRRLFKYYFMQ